MVTEVHPQVFLIARPALAWSGIQAYLELVGAPAAFERMDHSQHEAGTQLVEIAGRSCYKSWEVGLNPNVTRIRTDRREYAANILNSRHGAVLEHANYSFALANVSRVFTHELVRHRAGTAFSQESMRYVRLEDIPFEHPQFVKDDPTLLGIAHEFLESAEQLQAIFAGFEKLDDPETGFTRKKEITSAMRRYVPMGVATHMIFTANLRSLRWLTELRTAKGAEVEIRRVFHMIGEIMEREEPELWADFKVTEDGEWVPANPKA